MAKTIKVFEGFSGVGTQNMALNRLVENYGKDVINFELVGTSDVNEYAINSYAQIHHKDEEVALKDESYMRSYLLKKNIPLDEKGNLKNLKGKRLRQLYESAVKSKCYGDISKIKSEDLPEIDLFTYSFPCFTENNLVLTLDGYKKIKDIKVGDFVLTHKGRYKKVVNIFNNGMKNVYEVKGDPIDAIESTYNHRFYTKRKVRRYNWYYGYMEEKYEIPQWVELKDLGINDYLGLRINNEEKYPEIQKEYEKSKDGLYDYSSMPSLGYLFTKPKFWWLVGSYFSTSESRINGEKVEIVLPLDKQNRFEHQIKKRDFYWQKEIGDKSVKYIIESKPFLKFLTKVSNEGNEEKNITSDILNLPQPMVYSFLKGFLTFNQHKTARGFERVVSTSRPFIYALGHLVAKVYQKPYMVNKKEIDGVMYYDIVFSETENIGIDAFYEDGYIWYRFQGIEKLGDQVVYDIEVEEDHSFTVQGTSVHNCQDISMAGYQKGLEQGSNTRSSLLWECKKIIDYKKPKYLLMENVKNLLSARHKKDFEKWLNYLESLGYKNYYQVLNSKDYTVPQSRERVFCVSILDGEKDYVFPDKRPLKLLLKDILEPHVDENFYLTQKQIDKIRFSTFATNSRRIQEKDYVDTLCARDFKDPKCVTIKQIGRYDTSTRKNSSRFRVYAKDGLSPTLTTVKSGGTGVHVADEDFIKIAASRGRLPENPSFRGKSKGKFEQRLEIKNEDVSNTITTVIKDNLLVSGKKENDECKIERVRKLTPLEYWRLMGIRDDDFYKAQEINSNSQLYKQAGNAIVVDVLYYIFESLFIDKEIIKENNFNSK